MSENRAQRPDSVALLAALCAIGALASPLLKWGIVDSMWRNGVRTPAELFVAMKAYTNKGFAERITARTLVIDGEAEEFGQARELYAALTCPKDYLLFHPGGNSSPARASRRPCGLEPAHLRLDRQEYLTRRLAYVKCACRRTLLEAAGFYIALFSFLGARNQSPTPH
jgi:hypothetical protein